MLHLHYSCCSALLVICMLLLCSPGLAQTDGHAPVGSLPQLQKLTASPHELLMRLSPVQRIRNTVAACQKHRSSPLRLRPWTQGAIAFSVGSKHSTRGRAILRDRKNRPVAEYELRIHAGHNQLSFELPGLPRGSYTFSIATLDSEAVAATIDVSR